MSSTTPNPQLYYLPQSIQRVDRAYSTVYTLTTEKLEQIMSGAALMGSGGGGSIAIGRVLVKYMEDQNLVSKIQLIDPIVLSDDQLGVVVAGMGAPTAMTDSSKFVIAQNAYDAFNRYVIQSQGQHVDYLVPVEVGALNSLMPMLVSAQTGIPSILSDSMGRAVPTLTMTSYSANGISTNPSMLSNANTPSESVAILLDSASAVEALARPIISSSEFNSVAGLALWKMTGQQCKNYSVPGGIPVALAAGFMSKYAASTTDPLSTIQQLIPFGKVVVVGQFKQEIVTSGGFDLGSVTITDSTNPNNQVVVYNQNENLFVYSSLQSSPLITGPDVIAYIRVKDGTFLSNADLQDSTVIGADEQVALMLLPVHSMIFNNETIRGVVNQLMKPLGYAGPIVTVFSDDERTSYFEYMTQYGMHLLVQQQTNVSQAKLLSIEILSKMTK